MFDEVRGDLPFDPAVDRTIPEVERRDKAEADGHRGGAERGSVEAVARCKPEPTSSRAGP